MNMPQEEHKQHSKLKVSDFNMIEIIGEGSYSKVLLVRKKDDNRLYAMKSIKKDMLKKNRQVTNILIERHILIKNDSPFLVKMHYAFQDQKKLYFVLEYCPGGELFNLLRLRKRLSEKDARFYAAQIVLALKHLHDKDVVYRDLKPENVIIDKEGYIKLTDFGLSKVNINEFSKAYSICGTPEYLAPEILSEQGHGKEVDFWTLGCILFEMVTGLPPFMSNDRRVLFKLIREWEPSLPTYLSDDLVNLLSRLFQKNPAKRLGYSKGADEVLNHPWFYSFDMQSLVQRTMTAPFIPQLLFDEDVQNFDEVFTKTDISPQDVRVNFTPSQNSDQHMDGFSFQCVSVQGREEKPSLPNRDNSPLDSGFMSVPDWEEKEDFQIETGDEELNMIFATKNKIE